MQAFQKYTYIFKIPDGGRWERAGSGSSPPCGECSAEDGYCFKRTHCAKVSATLGCTFSTALAAERLLVQFSGAEREMQIYFTRRSRAFSSPVLSAFHAMTGMPRKPAIWRKYCEAAVDRPNFSVLLK